MLRGMGVALLGAALAGGAMTPAAAQDNVLFQSPTAPSICTGSGAAMRCEDRDAFACLFDPSERSLTCSIKGNVRYRPGRQPNCNEPGSSEGIGFRLTARGARRVCAEPVFSGMDTTPVLKVGETWERAGLRCQNLANTLRCTNAQGRGFHLRYQQQELF